MADAPSAFAYILRSNNDDDIHKSIKYGIWTSSKENNEKLNAKYLEAQELGI
ncbi:YTH domain-containing protein, partial [Yangia sp. PrR004]|nr:YTH domain-containing protein [Salipiger sp. PrR004]